jgi:hypothetical protein
MCKAVKNRQNSALVNSAHAFGLYRLTMATASLVFIVYRN